MEIGFCETDRAEKFKPGPAFALYNTTHLSTCVNGVMHRRVFL